MAKKKQLIDLTTMQAVVLGDKKLTPDDQAAIFNHLAQAAKKCGAGCVSASFRFDDGAGVANGEYIPELMLRVRKP
jgi:hypothetical protein